MLEKAEPPRTDPLGAAINWKSFGVPSEFMFAMIGEMGECSRSGHKVNKSCEGQAPETSQKLAI